MTGVPGEPRGRVWAQQTRERSRSLRRGRPVARSSMVGRNGWALEGVLEGNRVYARWDPHEHRLDADLDLIVRAEVIVAMGDTFVCPESSTIVTASLEDAFLRVTSAAGRPR